MKPIKTIYYLTILCLTIISFSSCRASFNKIKQYDNQVTLDSSNIEKLNGDFQLQSIDSSYRTLEHALFLKVNNVNNWPTRHIDSNYFTSYHINLNVKSRKELQVKLFKGNTLIQTNLIKGKIKKNYFVCRRQWRIHPLILVNFAEEHKTRLGLLENDNLVLDTANSALIYLTVLPFFGGDAYNHHLVFERIDRK